MPLLAGIAAAGALVQLWIVESSNLAYTVLLILGALVTFTASLLSESFACKFLKHSVKSYFEKWKNTYKH